MSTGMRTVAALALAAALTAMVMAGAGAFSFDTDLFGFGQPTPLIPGGELAAPLMPVWGMPPWTFGSPCDVPSLPLYFNAHGFGFPMSLGNFRIGLVPSVY